MTIVHTAVLPGKIRGLIIRRVCDDIILINESLSPEEKKRAAPFARTHGTRRRESRRRVRAQSSPSRLLTIFTAFSTSAFVAPFISENIMR